ncbi:MAG: flagellar assembly protein FliX [Maricaulaceae bacterium]
MSFPIKIIPLITAHPRPPGGARPAGEPGRAFAPEAPAQIRAPAQTAPTSAIASIDALIALQAGGDFREARKRATQRANSLLDVLEDIKIGLLEGGVPEGKLLLLLNVLRTQRDDVGDGALDSVLDEVELRAHVELAKHQANRHEAHA